MSTYDELRSLERRSPAPKPDNNNHTSKSTSARDLSRAPSSEKSREKVRMKAHKKISTPSKDTSREYPTRDEIQRFSFQLRDELKVKVQAEVPHGWQKELESLARKLDVKKLELYRFILGEFLGKVKRKAPG